MSCSQDPRLLLSGLAIGAETAPIRNRTIDIQRVGRKFRRKDSVGRRTVSARRAISAETVRVLAGSAPRCWRNFVLDQSGFASAGRFFPQVGTERFTRVCARF